MFIAILHILIILWVLILVLLLVALTTLLERKAMGLIQFRQGPNLTGLGGIYQPIADGIKLILKETTIPYRSHRFFFILAPIICFGISLMHWLVIPFWAVWESAIYPTDLSILLLLVFSSVNVYGLILAGWASTNKYSLLGSLRSSAQMLSYEICFTLSLLPVISLAQSLDLFELMVQQQASGNFIWKLFPSFILMYISLLAETNRVPFDLPEAEAELVSGFNTEYSAVIFALFFLGEYASVIFTAIFLSICFFSAQYIYIYITVPIILWSFLWIRASMPRYRYDQLMTVCWKSLLPLTLGYFFFISAVIYVKNWN